MSDAVLDRIETTDARITPLLTGRLKRPTSKILWTLAAAAAALLIAAVLLWQALSAHGNPDPTTEGISHRAAILDTGILVFREGLEAILVLTALTASLVRTDEGYWKPVAIGASASFAASVLTWFIVVGIISVAADNLSALSVQAGTGLLAIGVLLVIMNWFFHKVYWTGWITHHNRRKRELTDNPSSRSRTAIWRGLLLIGFTSVYREGFEVVLFLQSIRLQVGSHVVLEGVLVGLAFTLIVGWLTFVAHYRLPYKKMLVLTGVMLGFVLMVMVGENVQEMQQANWIPTHALKFHGAAIQMPDWLLTWFGVFPSIESLGAQAAAIFFVVGSYFLARRVCKQKRDATALTVAPQCILPDCSNCQGHHPANLD